VYQNIFGGIGFSRKFSERQVYLLLGADSQYFNERDINLIKGNDSFGIRSDLSRDSWWGLQSELDQIGHSAASSRISYFHRFHSWILEVGASSSTVARAVNLGTSMNF
jgi:hypothetical protein